MSMFIFREFFAEILEPMFGRGCTMLIDMDDDERFEVPELSALEHRLSIEVENQFPQKMCTTIQHPGRKDKYALEYES